jgi:RNA polymerase subunit RPABC4/transcription elongation factor Spt4
MEDRCVCCDRIIPEDSQYCPICGYEAEQKKQRQIDRIRNMSVEELAEFLYHIVKDTISCDYCPANDFCDDNVTKFGCSVTMLKLYLESEVEGE